jgi:hypothetical protein
METALLVVLAFASGVIVGILGCVRNDMKDKDKIEDVDFETYDYNEFIAGQQRNIQAVIQTHDDTE